MSAVGHTNSVAINIVDAGIFWDIENIPIHCARADEEARDAVNGMKKLVITDHFHDEHHDRQEKTIRKFVIVARMPGRIEPTPRHCKDRLMAHGVELIDLPFSDEKDYCDKEIIRVADIYAKEYKGRNSKIVIYLMTGDHGIIQGVNSIPVPFDLIVVILRGKRDLTNVTGHCRNIRRKNAATGRRIQIYFYEEVIRAGKGNSTDYPVNAEGVLGIEPTVNADTNRARRSRTESTSGELDEYHLDTLFR